jgi:hypothetical protein
MPDLSSAQVTVTSAATLLVSADNDGCRVLVHNKTATVVYLGASDVTASTGMGIDSAAGPVSINLAAGAKLYGIVASGTPTIQILLMGNN